MKSKKLLLGLCFGALLAAGCSSNPKEENQSQTNNPNSMQQERGKAALGVNTEDQRAGGSPTGGASGARDYSSTNLPEPGRVPAAGASGGSGAQSR